LRAGQFVGLMFSRERRIISSVDFKHRTSYNTSFFSCLFYFCRFDDENRVFIGWCYKTLHNLHRYKNTNLSQSRMPITVLCPKEDVNSFLHFIVLICFIYPALMAESSGEK